MTGFRTGHGFATTRTDNSFIEDGTFPHSNLSQMNHLPHWTSTTPERVLFIARQSLLLRSYRSHIVSGKGFSDFEIADSSDSKTHDKVDYSSKPLRQAMNRGSWVSESFKLRRISGRLKNLINCKNLLMRTFLTNEESFELEIKTLFASWQSKRSSLTEGKREGRKNL